MVCNIRLGDSSGIEMVEAVWCNDISVAKDPSPSFP